MTLLVPTDRPPTTPGEMLVEEFLNPLGITQTAFAERIGVTYPRLNEIVNGRRGVTPDTALRFAKALGTTPDFWLNLQLVGELYEALHGKKAADIDRIVPFVNRVGKKAADIEPNPRRRGVRRAATARRS